MKRKEFLKRSAVATGAFLFAPVLNEKGSANAATVKTPDDKPTPHLWKATDIDITWIGQATVLINFFGVTILTDPVLFDSFGIYFLGMTFGPRRYTKPALEANEIPRPDIVLLSHAHLDHMDYGSLHFLTKKYPGEITCITAKNTADVISDFAWKTLKEVDWNEVFDSHGIKFHGLEVQHFGWRFPWEQDRSRGYKDGRSYNAFAMEMKGKRIVFGGDTAYTEKFKEAKFDHVDVAIMPIGAYNPWSRVHANPEESLAMAQHMNAQYLIPIHFYTFRQGQEPIGEPLTRLKASANKYNINIGVDAIGGTLHIPGESNK